MNRIEPKDHSVEYVERFLRLCETFERHLRRAIVFIFILLVVFQALLMNDALRRGLSVVDRLEGMPADFARPSVHMVYFFLN